MAPELLFKIAGDIVLPAWLLLIFAPGWRWTQRVTTFVIPIVFAILYCSLLLTHRHIPRGGFNSLQQVAALFRVPEALLAGWIHYLAFDLFTGSWEVRDARRLGISHWVVVPCLVLTFVFGPAGLALYLLLRLTLRRRISAAEETE